MERRKHKRFDFLGHVHWDYFARTSSKKNGYLINISKGGCLLWTDHNVELRRWVRLVIQNETSQVSIIVIGRVTHISDSPQRQPGSDLLYPDSGTFYGIEYTYPNYFSLASTEVISALSSRNLIASSCRNLNSKSPLRPGFLA